MSPLSAVTGGVSPHPPLRLATLLQDCLIGLTVSFVALSLGAALGILSGRGALAGMLSAGVIAFVTSAFGGTRIQCSGPTAPMSAVTAVVVARMSDLLPGTLSQPQMVNLALMLTGAILILAGVVRLGRFISLIPNVVVSGFMNGIALLIWGDQLSLLLGLGTRTRLGGDLLANCILALLTLTMIFTLAPVTRRFVGGWARFLPATLVTLIILTAASTLLHLPVERIALGNAFGSPSEAAAFIAGQIPAEVTFGALITVLPFALQLALLCYLDTLLTSLVIDKMTGERTRQNRELMAQGGASTAVALLGGIPGAQATIRSVLMIKEGAATRLAGCMVGIFVLVEVILMRDLINMIPKAVLVGVLFKVGYDVLDLTPLRIYGAQLSQRGAAIFRNFFSRHDSEAIFITNREMLMILGTTLVTVAADLNTAVFGFTLLFYLHNRILFRHNPMRDLKPRTETTAFASQN